MKGKMDLLMNVNFFYPNGGNVAERNPKSMQYFILENC
jgi:hypothetical protein